MMTIGSLFTGYGGLDMAAEQVTNGCTTWHSEIEPAACRVLATRYPHVPNHGDITTINWSQVEPVDVITAGWPCQPFSLAGKRKGATDERALWPYVATAVRVVRPRLVFLENVSAIVTAGELARAVASLASLGYVGSWACVRAADVGAPHRRERCFIVACAADPDGSAWRWDESGGVASGAAARAEPEAGWGVGRGSGAPAADTDRDGRAFVGREHPSERDTDRCGGPDVAWGAYEPAIRRWGRTLGRVAPAPTEPGPKGGPRLSPRFVEWMLGLPAGWVTDVPGISCNDQLRMLGNGVVPQQAETALRWLLDHLRHDAAAERQASR